MSLLPKLRKRILQRSWKGGNKENRCSASSGFEKIAEAFFQIAAKRGLSDSSVRFTAGAAHEWIPVLPPGDLSEEEEPRPASRILSMIDTSLDSNQIKEESDATSSSDGLVHLKMKHKATVAVVIVFCVVFLGKVVVISITLTLLFTCNGGFPAWKKGQFINRRLVASAIDSMYCSESSATDTQLHSCRSASPLSAPELDLKETANLHRIVKSCSESDIKCAATSLPPSPRYVTAEKKKHLFQCKRIRPFLNISQTQCTVSSKLVSSCSSDNLNKVEYRPTRSPSSRHQVPDGNQGGGEFKCKNSRGIKNSVFNLPILVLAAALGGLVFGRIAAVFIVSVLWYLFLELNQFLRSGPHIQANYLQRKKTSA